MIEIIPTILVKKFEKIKERIKTVEPYVSWVHLDIMDGIFTSNSTWNSPKDLKKIGTKMKLEAHLMVQKPENVINDWLKVLDRIIIHYESKIDNKDLVIQKLIKKVHKKNKQIGLAISPDTPVNTVMPFLKKLDLVLIMTVNPGRGGQKFQEKTLEKIKTLRI